MVTSPPSTTISSSSVRATAPESVLVRYIRAHIKQGEKAKERAEQARDKAEQHFIAAGRYLTALKITYAPTWQHWETILKIKVKLSTSRASQLMQLADGRKDLRRIRDATAQRVKALRAARSSSLQDQCNEEDFPDELFDEGPTSVATAPLRARAALSPPANRNDTERLIDALANSTPEMRNAAVVLVVQGDRQTAFEAVTDAVIDLYKQLSRAGR